MQTQPGVGELAVPTIGTSPSIKASRPSLLLWLLPSPFPSCFLPGPPLSVPFFQSEVFQSHPLLLSLVPPLFFPPPSQAPGLLENPGQIFGRNTTCACAGAAPAGLVVWRFLAAPSRFPPGLGSCLGPLSCVSVPLGSRVGVPGRRGWLRD